MRLLVIAAITMLSAGCAQTYERVLVADDGQYAIEAGRWLDPQKLALTHCSKYGKRAQLISAGPQDGYGHVGVYRYACQQH